MSNQSDIKELLEIVALEREHRAELAKLVKRKRQLVVRLHEVYKNTFQQITEWLGVTSRQRVQSMYKKAKGI